MRTMKHLMLATAAAAALALAGCGGGGSTPVSMTEQQPTPYDTAQAAIARAGTAAEAQAAVDAAEANVSGGELAKLQEAADARQVELVTAAIDGATTAGDAQKAVDDAERYVSGAELAQLQAAADARKDELATMASAADQKTALMTAVGNIDTSGLETAADIAAANTAIAALKAALAVATDVSDADKAMYQGQVEAAEMAVASAQSALDHAAQTMALADAVSALQAIDLSDLSTQEMIDAANEAITDLRAALEDATELSASERTAAMTELATASRTVMAAQGSVDTGSQMMMLSDAVDALGMVDLDNLMTQAQINAANEAIIALDLALAAATDLTDAQKLDATVNVTVAKRKVSAAATVLAENVGTQREALTEAGTDLAAIDLADLDTAEKIAAAQTAVDALKMALEGATHLSDGDKAMYQRQLDAAAETVTVAETGMALDERMTAQRMAVTDAVTAATAAVGAVDDTATEDQVTAADNAIAALQKAIDDAVDLGEGDTNVASAQGALDSLMPVLANAKTSRTAAMEAAEEERRMAEAEEERKANEAMAATAAKLYAGIAAPMGTAGSPAAGDRIAAYAGANDSQIEVSAGLPAPPGTPVAVTLSEDKKTMVADNHGWEGKRYIDPAGGDMVEAIVYSNVGEPTQGNMISTILSSGVVPASELTDAANSGNVASPRFDHTAGTKEFELPDPNPSNVGTIVIPGSYGGVPGNYNCATTAGTACTVAIADDDNGFTLGGGTAGWTFTPTDDEARLMSAPDDSYASYGWWIHKSADGSTFIASAFADERGAGGSPVAGGLDALNGSATYMGGAAGKYALASSTGGTNDAGHFTARATLEADFTNNTDPTAISGTIDMFIGADGEARDWSVKLNGSSITDGGVIGDTMDGTIWTIGESAAAADGEWTGSLREVDTDSGVPEVATGTFYSTYGNAGRMVGGFGATKQ